MEINLLSTQSKENKIDKNDETKSKLLYKFKILNDSPKSNKYMGKCYLVNINSSLKKNFSVDKNKNILPPIMIKENNDKLFKSITLSDKKSKDSTNYKLNSDEDKKFPVKNFISHSTKRFGNHDKNIFNYKSPVALTEANTKDRKALYEEIIRKINERYFIKKSTVKYLTSLFFGSSEAHDLKYVHLSKIKGKREKEIYNNNYLQANNLIKNNLSGQKKSEIYEYSNEKSNDSYKLNKCKANEKLKYFRDTKMRKAKNLVNHAFKDVMKNRQKNLLFFNNIRKTCDYKYDDLGFVNYCD